MRGQNYCMCELLRWMSGNWFIQAWHCNLQHSLCILLPLLVQLYMGSMARVSYGLKPKINPLVLKQAHTLHTPICPLTIPGMHAKQSTSKRRARAALIMLRAYVNPQTGDLESASLTVVPSGLCLINYGFSNLQTCGRLPYIKTLPSPTPFVFSAALYTTMIYVRCRARYVTNGPISLSGCVSKVPCFAYWLSGALPFQGKMQVYCVNCSVMSCISCTAIRLLCSPCCQLPTPQFFCPKARSPTSCLWTSSDVCNDPLQETHGGCNSGMCPWPGVPGHPS